MLASIPFLGAALALLRSGASLQVHIQYIEILSRFERATLACSQLLLHLNPASQKVCVNTRHMFEVRVLMQNTRFYYAVTGGPSHCLSGNPGSLYIIESSGAGATFPGGHPTVAVMCKNNNFVGMACRDYCTPQLQAFKCCSSSQRRLSCTRIFVVECVVMEVGKCHQ